MSEFKKLLEEAATLRHKWLEADRFSDEYDLALNNYLLAADRLVCVLEVLENKLEAAGGRARRGLGGRRG